MTDQPNVTEARAAYVQVINEPRPAVEQIAEIDLKGEPLTDRAFETPSGMRFRARLIRKAELASQAPTNGDAALAPSQIALSLSLALLADDGSIARDAAGRLIITDAHEIILSPALMADGHSMEATIDLELRKAAHALEKSIAHQSDIDGYLADKWGGALHLV